MSAWTWAAASCRGTSHEKTGELLQDAHICFQVRSGDASRIVVLVSDGAGSARFGGQGAALICRSIGQAARRHLCSVETLPSEVDLEAWIDAARDLIFAVATRRGHTLRDFAATLVCAISDGSDTLIGHVGDGCAVVKSEPVGNWIAPTWPDHGEYASTTTFVTDEPTVKLRFTRHKGPVAAIVAFSDGLERLGLDFATREPSDRFFQGLTQPLFNGKAPGRNATITAHLKDFLNSEAINSRTDDDKTLVIAVKQ